MPALFPSMVAPEFYKVGDAVRKFISDKSVTPFLGTVTHVVPSTYKVWVQWPTAHTQESPEELIKVNPVFYGMPTAIQDTGYDSYEKGISERSRGMIPNRTDLAPKPPVMTALPMSMPMMMPMMRMPGIMPKRMLAYDKMAIRVAHTFATTVVDKLVDAIVGAKDQGMSDVQAYNRIYTKFSSFCSDYIIRSSIQKIYEGREAADPIQAPAPAKPGAPGAPSDSPEDLLKPDVLAKIKKTIENMEKLVRIFKTGYESYGRVKEKLDAETSKKYYKTIGVLAKECIDMMQPYLKAIREVYSHEIMLVFSKELKTKANALANVQKEARRCYDRAVDGAGKGYVDTEDYFHDYVDPIDQASRHLSELEDKLDKSFE